MQLKFVSLGLIATTLMVNTATIEANRNTVGLTNVGTSILDHPQLSNLADYLNGRVASRKRSLVSPKKIAEAIRRRGEEADEEEADDEGEVDEDEIDEDEVDEDEIDEDEVKNEEEWNDHEEEDSEMKRRGLTDTLPLGLLGGKKKN